MEAFLDTPEGRHVRRQLFNQMDTAAAPEDFEEEHVWPAVEQWMGDSEGVWFSVEWRTWQGKLTLAIQGLAVLMLDSDAGVG
jgi:hypothetical protein